MAKGRLKTEGMVFRRLFFSWAMKPGQEQWIDGLIGFGSMVCRQAVRCFLPRIHLVNMPPSLPKMTDRVYKTPQHKIMAGPDGIST